MKITRLGAAIGIVLVTCAAAAVDVGQIEKAVARARGDYEKTMESARSEVLKALDRKAENERKGKVDLAALKAIDEERRKFKAEGAWPDVINRENIRGRAADAAAKMIEAYAKAIGVDDSGENGPRLQAIRAESDIFASMRDIVPWGEDRADALANKVAKEQAAPIEVKLSDEGPYRIEIIGNADAKDAQIELDLPAPGARVKALAVPDDKGAVRIYLSLDRNAAGADLGVQRPLDRLSGATGEPIARIRATKGSFTLEQLRTKPIFSGGPERRAEKVAKKNDPAKKAPEAAPQVVVLKAKSKWTGDRVQKAKKAHTEVTVNHSDADSLQLHLPAMDGHGSDIFDFRVNGQQLVLTGMRYSGQAGRIYSDARGGGSFSDGEIRFNYTARTSHGNVQNQPFDGSVVVRPL
ncbi:MAG: hypothetical protein K2Y21_06820 [Phycisphaerales bacterium]|nr:hypothetical protein [Phycisphaerales bacterium]